jgi:hypothetical protein
MMDGGKQGSWALHKPHMNCPGIQTSYNNLSFIYRTTVSILWKDKQCKPYVEATSLFHLLLRPTALERLLKNFIYETFTNVR